ncbi:MAG: MATE family efflux transporter, partial [Xanthomonadales bacterium]|nr:MATE family efflux transporter [Xanthomonadales bacterium]
MAAQVWLFLSLVLDSLAIAAQAMVGRYLGSGRPLEAEQASGRMLQWGLLVGLVLGAWFWALGPVLPGLFTRDPEVIA